MRNCEDRKLEANFSLDELSRAFLGTQRTLFTKLSVVLNGVPLQLVIKRYRFGMYMDKNSLRKKQILELKKEVKLQTPLKIINRT